MGIASPPLALTIFAGELSGQKPESLLGFWELSGRFPFSTRKANPARWAINPVQFPTAVPSAGHRPLSTRCTAPAGWAEAGALPLTARRAGAEPTLALVGRVRLRGTLAPADAALAGSSPTTRSAGSGATPADHPPRARTPRRRAVDVLRVRDRRRAVTEGRCDHVRRGSGIGGHRCMKSPQRLRATWGSLCVTPSSTWKPKRPLVRRIATRATATVGACT